MSNKPVFISYSHDSPEHDKRVLALSARLRKDGIDTRLDQYVNGTPPEGWPRWMLNQLDEAEFVLLVCTESYYRRFRGHEQPGKGKGADWEGILITQEIYDARSRTVRFVPIVFSPDDAAHIPEPLGGATHYTINSDPAYEALYDFLLGQAGVEPGELGELRRKQRRQEEPLRFDGSGGPVAQAAVQVAPSRLTHSADKLIGRETELARLNEAWSDPTTHVLTIVAFGGVGKTSLVSHWQAELAKRDYDGASYFDWSFYSQGTREQGGASADQFVARALEFFGDSDLAASAAPPWDKGARLAQLVAQRRALLVLDGLEPLQYPPGPMAGTLRDPAVAALLKGLAQRNAGLCLVTTREHVSDLASFRGSTAPELELHHLSVPAGVELLKSLGVKGTAKEFEAVVKEVEGHALTLDLLGRFLVCAHGGDIRRRDRVRFEKADASVQGGHAFKAMAAYERWLAEGKEEGKRQLAILRVVGLFDRPVDGGCLTALRRVPAIAGLTEPIVELGEDDWNLAVASLGDCGLLSTPVEADASTGIIDAHPLIREYFASWLRDERPRAWREAHSRIYEYLCNSVEDLPNTLDRLQPLYHAVAHGCHARRYVEAREDVYRDRILHGNEFYSTKKLGAFGADLGAVVCFFEQPWSRVSPSLSKSAQGWLLAVAAFDLQGLGRLTEALQSIRAGLARAVDQGAWKNAAIAASSLSEIDLTLGDIPSALTDAAQSVANADRSDHLGQRLLSRTTLADAVHHSGLRDKALTLFREAEAMVANTLLYSVQGFQYCDLLLVDLERQAWRCAMSWAVKSRLGGQENEAAYADLCQDVQERARKSLLVVEPIGLLLDIALDHLTLGRTSLYQAVLGDPIRTPELLEDLQSRHHLNIAVEGLRRAGTQDHLPRGLMSRGWLRFLMTDVEGACGDLDEAWQIAERGPMRLHLADIHLHRARLFHAAKPYPWESPQADLAAARKLIEQCGYWRRKEELEDAEEAAKNW